jgi:cold shock CspA family protein
MVTEIRTKGTMLWFAEAKGHGYILTETEERLFVDRDGFVDRAAPVGRCAGLPVELTVSERDGRRIAVEVAPVPEEARRRARRRTRGY